MENGVPKKKVPLHILWSNMEKCVEMGLCKSIGVSNFNAQLLLDLVSYAKIQPVINQVELNPYFTQNDLVDVCKALNIKIMAYMPACKGSSAMRHKDIVEKYDLYKNEVLKKKETAFSISNCVYCTKTNTKNDYLIVLGLHQLIVEFNLNNTLSFIMIFSTINKLQNVLIIL